MENVSSAAVAGAAGVSVSVRAAAVSDIHGLVESTAALFAEDGAARDQLRNRKWPTQHGEQWCADLLQNHDALVVVADAGVVVVVGHLVGLYCQASDMWVAPRAELVSMHVHSSHRSLGMGSRLWPGPPRLSVETDAFRVPLTKWH